MTFEEQFPSLEKGVFLIRNEKGAVSKNIKDFDVYLDDTEEVVCTNVILEHCLDKQKVREAIEHLIVKLELDEGCKYTSYKESFNKELGL